MSLAAVGVVSPGVTGTPGASFPNVRALDATGKVIGPVSASGTVLLILDGRGAYVPFGQNGFVATQSLYFAGPSCTGAMFVLDTLKPATLVPVRGMTVFQAGAGVTNVTIVSRSEPQSPESCAKNGGTFDGATGVCCQPVGAAVPDSVGPAIPFEMSGFVPPFRVEVRR